MLKGFMQHKPVNIIQASGHKRPKPFMSKVIGCNFTGFTNCNIPRYTISRFTYTGNDSVSKLETPVIWENGKKFLLEYSVSNGAKTSHTEIIYGTIANDSVVIEDAKTYIKMFFNSSTSLTFQKYKLDWASITLERMVMYDAPDTPSEYILKQDKALLKASSHKISLEKHSPDLSLFINNYWIDSSNRQVPDPMNDPKDYVRPSYDIAAYSVNFSIAQVKGTVVITTRKVSQNWSEVYSTKDGTNWTCHDFSKNQTTGAYSGTIYSCYDKLFYYNGNSNTYNGVGLKYTTTGEKDSWVNVGQITPYAMCYGNSKYIMSCWNDNDSLYGLYYSSNGTSWSKSNLTASDGKYALHKLYYNKGLFIACSDNSTAKGLYYSTNGSSWTKSNISIPCYGVYFGNDLWVACTSQGLYHSTDGKTWTQCSNTSSYHFNVCEYHNGTWFAGGAGIWYSTDGKTWKITNVESTTYGIDSILYAKGLWVLSRSSYSESYKYASELYPKTEEIDTIDHGGASIMCKLFADNKALISPYGSMYLSKDLGKTFVKCDAPGCCYNKIIFNKGVFVAVADSHNGYNGGILYSEDGYTWKYSNIGNTSSINYIYELIYANGTFVALGNGKLYYSSDGRSWTELSVGVYAWINTDYLKYSAVLKKFIVHDPSHKFMWHSTNGLNWEKHTEEEKFQLVESSSLVLKLTPTKFLSTTDFISWKTIILPEDAHPTSISVANNYYYAGTNSNIIYYSTNGTSWTARTISSSLTTYDYYSFKRIESVQYSNGYFKVEIIGQYTEGSNDYEQSRYLYSSYYSLANLTNTAPIIYRDYKPGYEVLETPDGSVRLVGYSRDTFCKYKNFIIPNYEEVI